MGGISMVLVVLVIGDPFDHDALLLLDLFCGVTQWVARLDALEQVRSQQRTLSSGAL